MTVLNEVESAQMRPLIEAALRPSRFMHVHRNDMSVAVSARDPPVGMAFNLFVRDASRREWRLGSIAAGRRPFVSAQARGWLEGFDADVVDVILRSDPTAAAATVDLTEIWSGEIVFEGIEVLWERGTPRPTVLPEPTASPAEP